MTSIAFLLGYLLSAGQTDEQKFFSQVANRDFQPALEGLAKVEAGKSFTLTKPMQKRIRAILTLSFPWSQGLEPEAAEQDQLWQMDCTGRILTSCHDLFREASKENEAAGKFDEAVFDSALATTLDALDSSELAEDWKETLRLVPRTKGTGQTASLGLLLSWQSLYQKCPANGLAALDALPAPVSKQSEVRANRILLAYMAGGSADEAVTESRALAAEFPNTRVAYVALVNAFHCALAGGLDKERKELVAEVDKLTVKISPREMFAANSAIAFVPSPSGEGLQMVHLELIDDNTRISMTAFEQGVKCLEPDPFRYVLSPLSFQFPSHTLTMALRGVATSPDCAVLFDCVKRTFNTVRSGMPELETLLKRGEVLDTPVQPARAGVKELLEGQAGDVTSVARINLPFSQFYTRTLYKPVYLQSLLSPPLDTTAFREDSGGPPLLAAAENSMRELTQPSRIPFDKTELISGNVLSYITAALAAGKNENATKALRLLRSLPYNSTRQSLAEKEKLGKALKNAPKMVEQMEGGMRGRFTQVIAVGDLADCFLKADKSGETAKAVIALNEAIKEGGNNSMAGEADSSETMTLKSVPARKSPANTKWLYLVPAQTEFWICLVEDNDKSEWTKLPAKSGEIRDAVLDWLEDLQSDQASEEDVEKGGKRVSSLIFPKKLEGKLSGASAIYISAPFPWANVPWACLPISGDRTLEDIAPVGIQDVEGMESDSNPDVAAGDVMVGGFSKRTSSSPRLQALGLRGGLPELPSVPDEVSAVAKVLGAKPQQEITESRVKERLSSAKVIHLSGHGVDVRQIWNKNATSDVGYELSKTFLAGICLGPSDGSDGFLQVHELWGLAPLRASVITLSACDAGQGVYAGTLRQLGARSVVACNWKIADDEAKTFFVAFYESLKKGNTTGESMREARKACKAAKVSAKTYASMCLFGDCFTKIHLVP